MTDGPHCVALSTPDWPRGASPNGIVTYTAELEAALRETGVRPVILSWHVEPSLHESGRTPSSGDVVDICDFEPPRTLLRRLLEKASRTLGRNAHLATRFKMIEQAVRVAVKRYPIEVLEIEEARGIALPVIESRLLPVVVRLHGPWFLNGHALGVKEDAEFERRDKLEREVIARADAVTAPSRDVLERTRARYGLALEHAEVIYPPVESRHSGPIWDLDDCDRDRIVFVGRFDRHKGGDLMIEAFARIAKTRPRLTLDFVGPDRGVLDEVGRTIPLNEYLAVHVPDTDVRSRIVVHGQQPSATIDALRRRGLMTVVPSRYETFGYTAVEALSLGCPVIAANAGGLAESVRDGETGLLFAAGDARSLADKMATLLDAPQMAAQFGEAGRKDVASRYAPRTIAEQTLATYASVLSRRRGRSCGAERPKANA